LLKFGYYDFCKHAFYQVAQTIFYRSGVKRKIHSAEIIFPIEFARYYDSNNEPIKQKFIEDFAMGQALDLGAHIGLYTVLLSRKCTRVIAFEPSRVTREALIQTLKLNKCTNVEVRSECVTSTTGEIVFYDTGTRASNANSIAPIGKPTKEQSIRIDDLRMKFDFIKIDIEGSELLALRGATETLATTRYLTLEVHPELLKSLGQSPREIFELLSKFDPTYFYLGETTTSEILEEIDHQYEINIVLQSSVARKN
jgi:FkbM family methyltransferase